MDKNEPYTIQIVQGTKILKEIILPLFCDFKLSTHGGVLGTIELTTKEKLS